MLYQKQLMLVMICYLMSWILLVMPQRVYSTGYSIQTRIQYQEDVLITDLLMLMLEEYRMDTGIAKALRKMFPMTASRGSPRKTLCAAI